MIVRAVRADNKDFEKYGRIIRLTDYEEFADNAQGWRCWITEEFCMNQPARIGMGFSKEGAPYTVSSMKRHSGTKKIFVCGDGPAIVAVADTNADAASSSDIRAFIIKPGDLLVINEGIWYDACHGVSGPSSYYFVSLETDELDMGYIPLSGGEATIEAVTI